MYLERFNYLIKIVTNNGKANSMTLLDNNKALD